MTAYRIDPDLTVAEHDSDEDWMTADITWTTLPFDRQNLIIFDDEALGKPGTVMARVGEHARVPLPAYIVGLNGEDRSEPTIPIELVRLAIS